MSTHSMTHGNLDKAVTMSVLQQICLGSQMSVRGFMRMGSHISIHDAGTHRGGTSSVLSVCDFLVMGSATSIRGQRIMLNYNKDTLKSYSSICAYTIVGSTMSIRGPQSTTKLMHRCQGKQLSAFSGVSLGSTMSVRTNCRMGLGCSIMHNVRLGSNMSIRVGMRLGKHLSIMESFSCSSVLSCRGTAHMGSLCSQIGILNIASCLALSVVEWSLIASSLSVRDSVRAGSKMSMYGFQQMGSTLSLRGFFRSSSSLSISGQKLMVGLDTNRLLEPTTSILGFVSLSSALSVRSQVRVAPNNNYGLSSTGFMVVGSSLSLRQTNCQARLSSPSEVERVSDAASGSMPAPRSSPKLRLVPRFLCETS